MAKAVFIQNPASRYDDVPGVRYHFPRRYLNAVRRTEGDWVIFYESRKGAFGYVSVQKLLSVRADPGRADHFYAELDTASLLQFERVVPRAGPAGRAFETMLRGPDGRPISGGASASAVRQLSEADFEAILTAGLTPLTGTEALPRDDTPGLVVGAERAPGFAEEGQSLFGDARDGSAGSQDRDRIRTQPDWRDAGQSDDPHVTAHDARGVPQAAHDADAPLGPIRADVLTSRKFRDASFSRMVRTAYGGRCAISGLMLRNGGGRPEVEAAHIRPVSHGGPDIVPNGLALSGTLHWMFDRGLISIAEDHSILVAHNKVDHETAVRLIRPDGRLHLPGDPRHHPHPAYLQYHREEVFGAGG